MRKFLISALTIALFVMFVDLMYTLGAVARMIIMNGQNMSIAIMWGLLFGVGCSAAIMGFVTYQNIKESLTVIFIGEPEKEPEEEVKVNWLTPDE